MTTLLVPCDPLAPTKPDDHFAPEAEAATQAGWNVVRMDHDAVLRGGGTLFRSQRLEPDIHTMYRGWMIPSRQYAGLWLEMSQRGLRLSTTSSDYSKAHE